MYRIALFSGAKELCHVIPQLYKWDGRVGGWEGGGGVATLQCAS